MKIQNQKGFTLMEVVIVLTVMALLAVGALPRVIQIVTQAKKGARDNIAASVREGIFLQKVNSISEASPTGSYPATLDGASNGSCSASTGCFATVLEAGQQITDSRWTRTNNTTYQFDVGGSADSTYTYNATNGTFLCTAGAC